MAELQAKLLITLPLAGEQNYSAENQSHHFHTIFSLCSFHSHSHHQIDSLTMTLAWFQRGPLKQTN